MNNISTEIYEDIPFYDNGSWTTMSFGSRNDFLKQILDIFKEPGQYEFNELSFKFNEQAAVFNKTGIYCTAPYGTKDFVAYWDDQKKKCRKGVFFSDGAHLWFLPRDYYMWLNFLPIFNKETQKFGFASVRDAQYHMALYELIAELSYTHAAILKKRQIASSYYHTGKLINQIWFEEGVTLKMGAKMKNYVNEEGSWKFLDEYAAFLNSNTAWYRPMNPNKVLFWQQKIEVVNTIGNKKRKSEIGLKGVIQGMSFDKSPTKGVGGPCKYFFYEEGGIAPTAALTYEYLRPAMRSGLITTGMFIIAGSVGDLKECEPLKNLILKPRENDICCVESNLIDDKGTIGKIGLFIPEQWSMMPYIDKYGNSLVEEALEALNKQFDQWKTDLSPSQYQLRISQHPRNVKEAFDYRTVSLFPLHLITAQEKRIEDKEYPYQLMDIKRKADGTPVFEPTSKLPINEWPCPMNMEDKSGSIVVWEKPKENPKFGEYYASIDPVGVGKTTTSDSLCCIYIYKNDIEVTTNNGSEILTHIERGKIVATWCGRFDDINKTHERLELLIEIYNAWTLVENNIPQFITHMVDKKKQRYLVPKSQILFLKDIGANASVFQEYGWRNTGTLFKSHMLNYAIDYCSEEIDNQIDADGNITKITFGIERIPDPMLLKEMVAYSDDVNVDRLVAFSALIAFVKVQNANKGYIKRYETNSAADLKNKNLFSKLSMSPFKHIGGRKNYGGNTMKDNGGRSPFKNLK